MRKVTATELARNLREILNLVEFRRERVAIVRNNVTIAELIGGPPLMNAREAMTDLFGVLSAEAGRTWVKDGKARLSNLLKDPWDS